MIEVGDRVKLYKNWERMTGRLDRWIRADRLDEQEGPFIVREVSDGNGSLRLEGYMYWQGKQRFYKVGDNT